MSIEGFDEDIVLELIERSEKSIERVEKENSFWLIYKYPTIR